MSIIRDYEAEKEFELLRWLGKSIQELEALLDSPGRSNCGQQDAATKPIEDGSGTAGAVPPLEDAK